MPSKVPNSVKKDADRPTKDKGSKLYPGPTPKTTVSGTTKTTTNRS